MEMVILMETVMKMGTGMGTEMGTEMTVEQSHQLFSLEPLQVVRVLNQLNLK